MSLLGGIFVPLDYEQPIARQKNILRNLNPKVILLNSENKELQGDCVANTINLLQDNLEKQKIYVNSDNKVSDYAYVIYTSGTTGQPKGVVMSHKAVANTIDGINERFCVNNGSTFLGLSKLAFDLSIYDIFGCFDVGGTLVLPNETKAKNPEHWIELVELYNIQIWNSVPALFKMYLDTMKEENKIPNKSINIVFLSGDVIERNIPVLAKSFLKDYKMISLGGATEAAIWSIFYDITNYEGIEAIPYGQPLANQKFYVLDKELEQCPDYVVGEIVIAGEGLAEKYLNDDSLTKKKFLDVISLKERVYRTGDMGYYSDEGILHINGRIDNQIKVNGHRIETGEVESIINQIPGVKNSAVMGYDLLIWGIVVGIIGELILKVARYSSGKMAIFCYGVLSTCICGNYIHWISASEEWLTEQTATFGNTYVDTIHGVLTNGWAFPSMIIGGFLSGIIGGLIGRKVMKKHFEKSGLV